MWFKQKLNSALAARRFSKTANLPDDNPRGQSCPGDTNGTKHAAGRRLFWNMCRLRNTVDLNDDSHEVWSVQVIPAACGTTRAEPLLKCVPTDAVTLRVVKVPNPTLEASLAEVAKGLGEVAHHIHGLGERSCLEKGGFGNLFGIVSLLGPAFDDGDDARGAAHGTPTNGHLSLVLRLKGLLYRNRHAADLRQCTCQRIIRQSGKNPHTFIHTRCCFASRRDARASVD
mmetsp:Transcript_60441/g.160711  ORF Transcript_60441/g.160711 Transcript_60441/m.160711 type:complete len:228 (-) Transcript_60441:235-918(-)